MGARGWPGGAHRHQRSPLGETDPVARVDGAFFDIPAVREAAASFHRLSSKAPIALPRSSMAAGCLRVSTGARMSRSELRPIPGGPAIQRIELGDGDHACRFGSGRAAAASKRRRA